MLHWSYSMWSLHWIEYLNPSSNIYKAAPFHQMKIYSLEALSITLSTFLQIENDIFVSFVRVFRNFGLSQTHILRHRHFCEIILTCFIATYRCYTYIFYFILFWHFPLHWVSSLVLLSFECPHTTKFIVRSKLWLFKDPHRI